MNKNLKCESSVKSNRYIKIDKLNKTIYKVNT